MLCSYCGQPASAAMRVCSRCGRALHGRSLGTTVLTPPPVRASDPGPSSFDASTALSGPSDEVAQTVPATALPAVWESSKDGGQFTPAQTVPAPALPAGPEIGATSDPEATRLVADSGVSPFGSLVDRGETGVGEPGAQSDGMDATRLSGATEPSRLPSGFGSRLPGRPEGSGGGPLVVGQDFGTRYHILRLLGMGGMGAVYQAWDEELGVAVALKIVRPETMQDPKGAAELERRFKRELLLARQVTHKNVVRIHDLGEVNGIKYITMPYIEGDDLATVLKRDGRLAVPQTLRIARQVVAGMVAAHGAGIVHRDLKPANIMIDAGGEALVMDFGIARSAGGPGGGPAPKRELQPGDLQRHAVIGETVSGGVVGTVQYMAPEQAKGRPADQRADIYALGLIFYDMLVGKARAEHAQSAIAELQGRMLQAPPAVRTIVPEVPAAVDELISRCLEPDPEKRYPTSAELAADLARLDDDGEPIPIPPRFTRKMMLAAAALVLLLLGGTFYTANRLAAPPKEHDPVSVVIADFQNHTNDPTFDNIFGQTVRRALEDASFISAYDRTRISTLGVRPPETLDEGAARDLALKQGLAVVLAGSIAPRGAGYEISVRAGQTVTGDVIANVRGVASHKDQVLEIATRLVARVRKALGDDTSESAQLFAMRSLTTSSLEVVSHYALAVEAQSKGQFEEAYGSYSRAVGLDPTFALGYQGLAAMSRNLGRAEDAEKYIKEALRYLDGLTERERFSMRGYYYRTMGEPQQCAKEYGELLARYPLDTVARVQRAGCLGQLRQARQALDEMRRAVQMVPNHSGYQVNLAVLATTAGEFEAAEAEVNAMPQPPSVALMALAYSQIGRGLVREATQTYERVLADPRFGTLAAAGLGDVRLYEGRFSAAVRSLEEGADADLAAKQADKAALKFTSVAYAHLMRGQSRPAVAAADKALLHSQSMAVRFLAARILAEAGALDRARSLAADLSSSSERSGESQAHGKIIEGLIALKSGNPHDAIRILTEANALLDTWIGRFDLGRAHLEAGAFVQADSEFDLCLARRGEALSLMGEGPTYGYFPIVYYYQGRVREELNTAGFAESYREYLRIRGESTEDPLVPEVRRRLAT
jgi:eukaryotic-like serine/threonine-protein kinase